MNRTHFPNRSRPADGHLVEIHGPGSSGATVVRDVANADALVAVLDRQRIAEGGVPHLVVVDNSLDFTSVALRRYCHDQGIALSFGSPTPTGGTRHD